MKPETIVWSVVREAGLEPARREASGPKPGASTNFATRALWRAVYRRARRSAGAIRFPNRCGQLRPVRGGQCCILPT